MKKDIQNKTNIETTNTPKSNLKLELIVWGIITIIVAVFGITSNIPKFEIYFTLSLLILLAYIIR